MTRQTLTGMAHWAEEIKRSRFLACAGPIRAESEAEPWLAAHRNPEATHNAWAFCVGNVVRFSDDGEVGGTAGKPILGAIEKQGLDRVIVLVTRFYGGIRLGTGGLVRAYGGTAANCLREASRRDLRFVRRSRFLVPFSEQSRIYRLLERLQIERVAETFLAEGLRLEIRCTPDQETALQAALQDLLRGGDPSWEPLGDEII